MGLQSKSKTLSGVCQKHSERLSFEGEYKRRREVAHEITLPEGLEIRSTGKEHQVWQGSRMLRRCGNLLELKQWAASYGETIIEWNTWLFRPSHDWNGVIQL